MTAKQPNARERILDIAQQKILLKGYSATSIDEIRQDAHITKGGFFYHFNDKNELALALVQRYLDSDEVFFNDLFERAESLSEDPLQQMLLFLKLLAEAMGDIPNGHPGCLVAAFIYQSMQFEDNVLELIAKGMLDWRQLFKQQLLKVQEKYPMKTDVSIDELADNLTAILEGGIVTSLVLKDPDILSKQILHYRNYIRLLFGDV